MYYFLLLVYNRQISINKAKSRPGNQHNGYAKGSPVLGPKQASKVQSLAPQPP